MNHITKRWEFRIPASGTAEGDALRACAGGIASDLGISQITALLLAERGCGTPQAARSFIALEAERFHDPFLLRDMDRAVERIGRALDGGEKITVYGDYDADGLTAAAILCRYLRSRGGEADYYIPAREGDGYGLAPDALRRIAMNGTKLIVTVDTGATAVGEIEFASSLGLDVVVTDHHKCPPELPPAYAVVNPRRGDCGYPYKDLAGVGVAFKLISALESVHCAGEQPLLYMRRVCRDYLGLTAAGTIADVMPLTGENRLIAGMGLKLINDAVRSEFYCDTDSLPSPANTGLLALLRADRPIRANGGEPRKVTSNLIGFTIAPRINSAGRMGDAGIAAELLMTDNAAAADRLAGQLCQINRSRQEEENEIVRSAYNKLGEIPHGSSIIILSDDGWRQGIIGIAASRLGERFGLPAVLVTFAKSRPDCGEDEPEIGRGSCRSVAGFDITAALASCADLLEKFGGHALAAGFSVSRANFDEFRERMEKIAGEHFAGRNEAGGVIRADCELAPGDISIGLAGELAMLEPFGTANPEPIFAAHGVKIAKITPVGGGKHTKMLVYYGGVGFDAIYFGITPYEMDLYADDEADLLFNLDINQYMGRKTVQMLVRDVKCRSEFPCREAGEERYAEICGGGRFGADEDVIPERADFAAVFREIKRVSELGHDVFGIRSLITAINKRGFEIGYIKLKFAVRILCEIGVLELEEITGKPDLFRFAFPAAAVRADLEESSILKTLRGGAESDND